MAPERSGAQVFERTLDRISKVHSKGVDYQRLLRIGRDLLEAIGEDPNRPGLVDTPRRWADWWREFIEYESGRTETVFGTSIRDQMVCVSGLRLWTLCEHHLLPFWCDVSIAYIPDGQVLGLSKFARVAQKYAHRLQIQEQLVHQIAHEVMRLTGTNNVAVWSRGEHLCMNMRGVRMSGGMTTFVLNGAFKEDAALRAEFLQSASQ